MSGSNEKDTEIFPIKVKSVFSKTRHELDQTGWGFKDSYYTTNDQGTLTFAGNRYA